MTSKKADQNTEKAAFTNQLVDVFKSWIGGVVVTVGLITTLYTLTLSPIHAQIDSIKHQVHHTYTDTEIIKEKISNIQENIKNIYDLMKQRPK